MRYAMVVDTKRCIGCQTCGVACKVENNLPNEVWWNRVLTVGGKKMDTAEGRFPNVQMGFLTVNCQHCDNPPCVKACPVGATYKREEDGVVIQDYDKCIGCRMCMMSCPYSARTYNWKKPAYAIDIAMGDADIAEHQHGVVEKCTFCVHRLARGEAPACVGDTCPVRARTFGDMDDPNSDVAKALQGREFTRLHADKGTKPSIYYLK